MNNVNQKIKTHPFSIVDSHCHLTLIENHHATLHQELEHISLHDMYLLDVGIEPHDLEYRKITFSKYKHIYFSVGLHPNYCEKYTVKQVESVLHQAIPHADAIGECGLDWFIKKSNPTKQREIFQVHLTMAFEYKKPLIIHSRGSLEDIIHEINIFYKKNNINIQSEQYNKYPIGVIHCFSGTKEQAQQCLELGFYISFTANISYKKNIHLQEIIKTIPKNKLLLETDAPYLSHQKIRSEINHPKNMPLLYETVAALQLLDMENVVQNTKANLFHFLQMN